MKRLREEQLRLQSRTIEDFEVKITKVIEKKQKSRSKTIDDTFIRKYLKNIAEEIFTQRSKKLSTVIGKIFIDTRYRDEVCDLVGDRSIKDYKLEDKGKEVAIEIVQKIDYEPTFFTDIKKDKPLDRLIKRTFEILKEMSLTLDESLKALDMKQKEQRFALATILLTSGEIAWLALKSISNLLLKDLYEEDDNSTSQQAMIKQISEELFEHIAFRLKREKKKIEEWENDTEIDIGELPFSLLMDMKILEEYAKDGSSLNLKFSDAFRRETKKVYDSMIRYMPPSYEPMIVPPTHWTTIDDGGFLKDVESSPKYDLYIMKSTTKRDRINIESLREDFSPMLLQAINAIQDTPWEINSDVVDDLKQYLKIKKERNKERLKKLEKIKKKRYEQFKEIKTKIKNQRELLEEMQIDENAIDEKLKDKHRESKEKRYTYQQSLKDIGRLENDINIEKQTLDKAIKYRKYSEIFFVWQIDFRGRAYPAQPLLNPQGDDFAKSLLRFATKKPLGEGGERWLKIHGANLYGVDKVSFDDRVRWIDEHTHQILAIFESEHKFDDEFLKGADKPFGFLAFAYEYREFIRDPKNFNSSIVVAMDGSNNGFQHITALLRDEQGAQKVNVLPEAGQTKPNDIYADVAIATKKLIDEDADNRLKEYIDMIDINRDLTKKNVMTEVYGAGRKAKQKQIKEYMESRLKDLDWDEETNDQVATYLSDMIAKAMEEELSSSAIYKKWMRTIAKNVSKQNRELRWRTPIIGLEVIQEEFKNKKSTISTKYNGKKNSIQIKVPTDKIDTRKQPDGIAPNFIHSLDATHLFLTILKSREYGIDSFATIHDSFGTHACDIDRLREAISGSFIEMYEGDLLKILKDEIKVKYNIDLEPIKYLGTVEEFDRELVRRSLYFFS